MNDEIEKMRINKSKGLVSLLDFDLNQVAYRVFKNKKQRKDIIDLWKRTYKLDDKSYYIVISHD